MTGHSQNVELSGGASGAPLALWNDAAHRANIQAVLDSGDVDVFGMTCCDWQLTPGGDPVLDPEGNPILSLEGWQTWFDYALAQNPDTEFFIGYPGLTILPTTRTPKHTQSSGTSSTAPWCYLQWTTYVHCIRGSPFTVFLMAKR